ncbi:MAG: AAA family ATPase [Asticcacaulis sp.]
MAVLAAEADEVIETSCAVVILKDGEARKLKKPVDFGFLDFTTVEKRREALNRELYFNRRTAEDIYRRVEDVAGEPVLVMRRFDHSQVLAEQARSVGWAPDLSLMEALGAEVARFHAGAERSTDPVHMKNTEYVIGSNRKHIESFAAALGPEAVDAYHLRLEAVYSELEPLVLARFDSGHIRRCHGDLHMGNILIEDHAPVLFDCIEFNERLMQIDGMYDIGFLLMDLWVRGYRTAANRVLNAYLETAARHEPEDGLYAGLRLLPLYMSMRAGVRCHVSAHAGDMAQAKVYLEAAHRFLNEIPAELVCVGGLSGSGKSWHARKLAPDIGRATGAVILRSDEVRKRLWQSPSLERLPPEAYSAEETDRVYGHMLKQADIILSNGHSVILDATFRDEAYVRDASTLAYGLGADFKAIWMDVPAEERLKRVAARQGDVSDATVEIAARQAEPERDPTLWTLFRPSDNC